MFRTMSRLTFGVYLIHPDIMRATLASQRHPIYASDIKIVIKIFVTKPIIFK